MRIARRISELTNPHGNSRRWRFEAYRLIFALKGGAMKVELNTDVEARLRELVNSGQFPSIEAAVNYGASLLHEQLVERDRKMADLRATLAGSIAGGGTHSADEVHAYLAEKRKNRRQGA
jgi:Arc/MetJ-type ribon-helix-helix transcriptional regulator